MISEQALILISGSLCREQSRKTGSATPIHAPAWKPRSIGSCVRSLGAQAATIMIARRVAVRTPVIIENYVLVSRLSCTSCPSSSPLAALPLPRRPAMRPTTSWRRPLPRRSAAAPYLLRPATAMPISWLRPRRPFCSRSRQVRWRELVRLRCASATASTLHRFPTSLR
jgi:hypothetical protein